MLLIGLDAASRWTNFGYAIGRYESGVVTVEEAGLLESREEADALASRVAPRLREADRGVIAIDAPLGWPRPFVNALKAHRAGEPLDDLKERLFRRETDRVVATVIGRTPLEVAADRIARAAHSALLALGRLRELTGNPMPLAWSPDLAGIGVIEVYPAATLKARGLPHARYKDVGEPALREEIAVRLAIEIAGLDDYVAAQADVFDACLCLVAAKDFIEGRCLSPNDLDLARHEGWIWVRGSE
jgi:predicted nuclease with RNAse H fold